jgi:hypothetical protein
VIAETAEWYDMAETGDRAGSIRWGGVRMLRCRRAVLYLIKNMIISKLS